MCQIIGIDTGGTYTDGVLLDFEKKLVLKKAKTFTTPQDLTVGIAACIDRLGEVVPELITMVCLSTTLATNAIVEGRGCRVGLILIGFTPPGKLPAHKIVQVAGGHDIYGIAKSDLDLDGLATAIRQMKGQVDTVAISALLSIRNPAHEQLARDMVRQAWDVPVVCAHELSSTVGFYERTVTACLNARLLPVISDLLAASRTVLRRKGIHAPLMIVKGDGSLISESAALERPVETIMSGPAASVVGATFLTGMETVLTLDMGGTTTDIGIIKNKRWRMNREGAIVAGWRTHVNTAAISTFGIGGDSHIQVPQPGQLIIGPKRVWPLSVAGARYPHLVEELRALAGPKSVVYGQTGDCWMALKPPPNPEDLSQSEQSILDCLRDGPHNLLALETMVGEHLSPLALKSLEAAQYIGRISFTPTDVLHCLGIIHNWNREAAGEGARLLAALYGAYPERFAQACLEKITQSLTLSVLQSIASSQGYAANLIEDSNLRFLLDPFFQRDRAGADFRVRVGLNYPIVAIGAPVNAYLPAVGSLLETQIIIPEHSEVANAVGAAVGKVAERVTAIIKPGWAVHAPWGYDKFPQLEDARQSILTKGKALALDKAQAAGVSNPELVVNREESMCETPLGKVFIEESYEIIASGYPNNRTTSFPHYTE